MLHRNAFLVLHRNARSGSVLSAFKLLGVCVCVALAVLEVVARGRLLAFMIVRLLSFARASVGTGE